MSDLQISLLAIGVVAVLGVIVYNLWQQRRFRRKYGVMFQPEHDDILSAPTGDGAAAERVEHVMGDENGAGAAPGTTYQTMDAALLFPDEATDYVTVLSFSGPESAQVLAPLWQRRFDFGKTIYACGLNASSSEWEKVIPESLFSYLSFKLSLQLADRVGAISEARLEDFRNLVRGIAADSRAEAELPDVAAAAERARALDEFCYSVDQTIGLNIVPNGDRHFSGGDVARVAAMHDMTLQANGKFHLFDTNGNTLYSLGCADGTPLQHHTLGQTWVAGLTLLMEVPCVTYPVHRFEEMAVLARQLAMNLHAVVVDDNGTALGEAGITQIGKQVAVIENEMLNGMVSPGSTQARRLFS